MVKKDYPVTQAVRFLRANKINFKPYTYAYQDHGGALHAAESLGVSVPQVVKTLVMEIDSSRPLLVLMHADREVSTKQLARQLGVKRVSPCSSDQAYKNTGFKVGGIGPFGTRKTMPVYVEASIFTFEKIYINGGQRGFMIEIDPQDLRNVLPVHEVNVAL
jgi:Cys-tRNA(Pro) deacylase